MKLTKAQAKNNARIEAWVQGVPFPENSRDKRPSVPVLTPDEVLEQYTPPYPEATEQFFTPHEIACPALSLVALPDQPLNILEPAAGHGALIRQIDRERGHRDHMVAFELELAAYTLGHRLFPWVEWYQDSPFAHLSELRNCFDFAFFNPPFGKGVAMNSENTAAQLSKTKSHQFLWLVIEALKPGCQAVMIAPSTVLERMPQKMADWFQREAHLDYQQPMTGEFTLTKIKVDAFVISKREADDNLGERATPANCFATADIKPCTVTKPLAVRGSGSEGQFSFFDLFAFTT